MSIHLALRQQIYSDFKDLETIPPQLLTKDAFNAYVREKNIQLPAGGDATNILVFTYDPSLSVDNLEFGPCMEIPPELLFESKPHETENKLRVFVDIMKPSKFFFPFKTDNITRGFIVQFWSSIGFVSCVQNLSPH